MWRYFCFLCCVAVLSGGTSAQERPLETTVCKILESPAAFDGKLIRLRALVVAAWSEFEVVARECGLDRHAIWLRIPAREPTPAEETKVDAEVLSREQNLQRFRRLLLARIPAKGKSGTCIACYRYDVTATLVGQLQAVENAGPIRDEDGKVTGQRGFGHDGSYRAQLVIQSVSDIVAKDRTSKYK